MPGILASKGGLPGLERAAGGAAPSCGIILVSQDARRDALEVGLGRRRARRTSQGLDLVASHPISVEPAHFSGLRAGIDDDRFPQGLFPKKARTLPHPLMQERKVLLCAGITPILAGAIANRALHYHPLLTGLVRTSREQGSKRENLFPLTALCYRTWMMLPSSPQARTATSGPGLELWGCSVDNFSWMSSSS